MEKLKAENQVQLFPSYAPWLSCFLISGMEINWPIHLAFQKSRPNTIARLQNPKFVTPTRDDLSAPRFRQSQMFRVHLALTAELYNARHWGGIHINSAIPDRTHKATLHIAVIYIVSLLFIIIIIIGHSRHSSTLLYKMSILTHWGRGF